MNSNENYPWMTEEISQEVKLSHIERDILELKRHNDEQDKLIEALRTERDRALIWGILALGGLVVTFIGIVASYIKDHLK